VSGGVDPPAPAAEGAQADDRGRRLRRRRVPQPARRHRRHPSGRATVTDSGERRGLDSVLADVLADLANRSLDLDPASRARLTALEGRRLQLSTTLPGPLGRRDFTLTVSGG